MVQYMNIIMIQMNEYLLKEEEEEKNKINNNNNKPLALEGRLFNISEYN